MSSTPITWSRVSCSSREHPAQVPLTPTYYSPCHWSLCSCHSPDNLCQEECRSCPQAPKQAKLSRRSLSKTNGLTQGSSQATPSQASSTNQPIPGQALSPYVGAGGIGIPVSALPPCRGLLICQTNQGHITHRDPSPMFLGLPLKRTCGQLTTFSLGRMTGLSQVPSF